MDRQGPQPSLLSFSPEVYNSFLIYASQDTVAYSHWIEILILPPALGDSTFPPEEFAYPRYLI